MIRLTQRQKNMKYLQEFMKEMRLTKLLKKGKNHENIFNHTS